MFSRLLISKILRLLQQFLLLLGAKMGRHNVPPTCRIEKCCQLSETCSTMMDWIEERSS